MTKTIQIGGMTCPHCAARIEAALNALDGVTARVNTAAKAATVECSSTVSEIDLIRAVQKAGYQVLSLR